MQNKMFSILLLQLSALLYFDSVSSFKSFTDLKKYYINNVWNPKLNEVKQPICDVSYEKWAGFCTEIVTKIRENEYYDSLRVSYSAFYTVPVDEKCVIRTLGFLSPLPDGNYIVNQQMMSCFGRQALVSAKESINQYKYYNELAIYPSNEKTMMVFKYDQASEVFMLLETYEEENWPQTKEVPNDLFTLQPPMYIEKKEFDEELYRELEILEETSDHPKNVINRINEDDRYKIEYMAFQNTPLERYGNLVSFEELLSDSHFSFMRKKKVIPVVLYINKCAKQFFLNAYLCSVRQHNYGKLIYLRMAAGPNESSVLFLSRTTYFGKHYYKITLMIKNLHWEFLSYYL